MKILSQVTTRSNAYFCDVFENFHTHKFASEKKLINYLLRYINTLKNDPTLSA